MIKERILLTMLTLALLLLIISPLVIHGKDNNGPEYKILIDIEEAKLYLLKDNVLVKSYPIATGKYDTPSPIGYFRIIHKARWGGGFGTRWMGLDVPWGKYGIHGTNNPGSIGWATSHGCFRMRNKDVEELYEIVSVGVPVIIYGGQYGLLGNGYRKLIPGDRGSHILAVQIKLKQLGYYTGNLDGIYGVGMERALLKFKRDNGLPYDKDITKSTYRALGLELFE